MKAKTIAKVVGVPAASLLTGVGVGYGGRKEARRWKTWRGDDGGIMLIRKGKSEAEKKAFEKVAQRAFDRSEVMAAYGEELEKIAFFGAAGRMAGGAVRGVQNLFRGARRTGAGAAEQLTQGWRAGRAGNTVAEQAALETVQRNAQEAAARRLQLATPKAAPGPAVNAAAAGAKPRLDMKAPEAPAVKPNLAVAPKPDVGVKAPAAEVPAAGAKTVADDLSKAPAAGAGQAAPGFLQTHLGVNPSGGMAQFGDQGMGAWFQGLNPQQQANLKNLGIGGLAAGTFGAGAVGGAMMAGGNGQTVVYR